MIDEGKKDDKIDKEMVVQCTTISLSILYPCTFVSSIWLAVAFKAFFFCCLVLFCSSTLKYFYFLMVNNNNLQCTFNSHYQFRSARNVDGTGARPPWTASARSTNWWTSTSLPPPPPPPRSVRTTPRSRRHRARQKRTLSCCSNSRQRAVTTAMKSPNIGQISCPISPTILFDDYYESRRCHVFLPYPERRQFIT